MSRVVSGSAPGTSRSTQESELGFRHGLSSREAKVMKKDGGEGMSHRNARDLMVDRKRKKKEPDFRSEIMRKLAPDFVPERKAKHCRAGTPLTSKSHNLNVDGDTHKPVQSLEEAKRQQPIVEKSNTLPFSKPPITIDEMQKTKVTTMGVLPSRKSCEIDDLKIIMQGQQVTATSDDEFPPKLELDRMADQLSPLEEVCSSIDSRLLSAAGSLILPRSRPAGTTGAEPEALSTLRSHGNRVTLVGIFGELGTVSRAPVAHREERQPLGRFVPDPNIKKIKKVPPPSQKEDLDMYRDDLSSVASGERSILSTEELLAEARSIARPGKEKKSQQNFETGSVHSKASSVEQVGSKPTDGVHGQPDVRSVEEIIASLRETAAEGGSSEADRRIDMLMTQMMASSSEVMMTEESSDAGDTDPNANALSDMTSRVHSPEDITDLEQSIVGPTVDSIEETLAQLNEDVTSAQEGQETEPPIEDQTSGDKLPEEDTTKSEHVTAPATPLPEEAQLTKEEAHRILAETSMNVTYADLVSVKGEVVTGPPNLPKVMSKPKRQVVERVKSAHVEKSIHVFCREGKTGPPQDFEVAADPDGLTKEELGKLWRLNHVPDKHRKALENNLARIRMMQVSMKLASPYPSSAVSGSRSRSSMTRDSMTPSTRPTTTNPSETRAIEAADRILFEAESLESWQTSANRILEMADQAQEMLSVLGKTAPMHIDPLSNMWEPAPPKMLATPQRVRNVLFPEYRGTLRDDLVDDLGDPLSGSEGEEDEDVDGKESKEGAIDPEFLFVRERILTRQYSSLEELSPHNLARRSLEVTNKNLPPLAPLTPLVPPKSATEAQSDAAIGEAEEESEALRRQATARLLFTSPYNLMTSTVTCQPLRSSYFSLSRRKERLRVKKSVSNLEAKDREAGDIATAESSSEQDVSRPSSSSQTSHHRRRSLGQDSEISIFQDVLKDQVDSLYASAPNVHLMSECSLVIYDKYDHTMQELAKQREMIERGEVEQTEPLAAPNLEDEGPEALENATEAAPDQVEEEVIAEGKNVDDGNMESGELGKVERLSSAKRKAMKPTPAELALAAGRSYVILPKKKKGSQPKKSRPVSMSRRDAIERFMEQKTKPLTRRVSFTAIKRPPELDLRVPKAIRSHRRNSIPTVFNFDKWAKENGYRGQEDPRDWVVVIWDAWFDTVYPPAVEDEQQPLPPSKPEPAIEVPSVAPPQKELTSTTVESITAAPARPITFDSEDSMEVKIPDALELPEKIAPLLNEVEEEYREEVIKLLTAEVDRLTAEMEVNKRDNAFYLCRRGGIYRRLGYMSRSLSDLNKAIKLEPEMLDAYWHRHLVLLVANRYLEARSDLDFLLKRDNQNPAAYKSRAEIYRIMGNLTLAVFNYGNAIRLDPNDHEAYFQRAGLYEQRGEMRLALEDYSESTRIKPDKTEAILKHGMYYFNSEQWTKAVKDFTELLKQDPLNSEAHTLRGQALSKLGLWMPAVTDFSAAIHLNPNNAKAFYLRGCLLRKAQPNKALQDFSTSLLIDSSDDNVMCFLHRGIIYCDLNRMNDAIPDYEAVIELTQDIACAHINLGLIYFKMELHPKAIKYFTSGLKAEPTYLRGFVCRAEAYAAMKDYKNALLDITRAIHIRPDNPHYLMLRGQFVLNTGNLELAAFCVRHAAEMNQDLGSSATQQALVQTFLKNYDKAIEALAYANKLAPSQELLTLLGKTQMKAERWDDAITTFSKCLEQLEKAKKTEGTHEPQKPWNLFQAWPLAAADVNFNIALCHMEQKNYTLANEVFKTAISIKPKFAEAYYQRGLCRIRLKQGNKGIQDFNRALSLDPRLYQIFLSRACYYGIKGRHTKAILNCNEAIKLQPKCVRAYLYRGSLKYHIKAYNLAIADLSHTVQIDNRCTLAFFNRAICYHEAKNYPKALQDYGVVLLLKDPKLNLKVLINRGLLYFSLGDFQNALLDFILALEDEPLNHRLLHTIGYCHHKLGNLNDAVRSYTQALSDQANFFEAYIGRGNVFMDFATTRGRVLAARDYQRVLISKPDHMIARINLAFCLQVSGKFWQAWRQFTVTLIHHPLSDRALEGRAIVCLQMSDPTSALKDLHTAVQLNGTAEVYNNRGVVHQFLGDRVNAIRDYKKASLVDPSYGLAFYNQGIMYLHGRQLPQALESFTTAVTLLPKDEAIRLNRGIARALSRDLPGALEDFDAAIELSPYTGHVYFNRGNVHYTMGEWAKAETDFSKALSLVPDDPFVYKARADCRGKLGNKEEAIEDYKMSVYISSKLKGE